MNQIPLVSVIIPSYNRAQLSLRAIESVLKQTYKNIELIFVNDGSTEDYSVIESLLSDAGAKYFKTINQGVSEARNLGIRESTGDFIAFLDSDDEWVETKLEKQVNIFREHPEYRIVQACERWIRNGKEINIPQRLKPAHGESFEKALEHCCIGPSSVLIKKEVFNDLGVFDPVLRICEDYDLWLRVLDRYPVYCIQEELNIKYGGHDDQLSRSEEAIDRFRVYALLKYLKSATDPLKRQLVIDCLSEKLRILILGAEKRGLRERLNSYQGIKNILLNGDEIEKNVDGLLSLSLNILRA